MHDERYEAMLKAFPLTEFSIYSDLQCEVVRDLGEEILSCLEETITKGEGTTPCLPGTASSGRPLPMHV